MVVGDVSCGQYAEPGDCHGGHVPRPFFGLALHSGQLIQVCGELLP